MAETGQEVVVEQLGKLGLSAGALALYQDLLRAGTLVTAEQAAADELVASGLASREGDALVPQSPTPFVNEWLSQQQRLMDEVRAQARELARAYDRRPGAGDEALSLVYGAEAVGALMSEMLSQANDVVRGLDRGPYIIEGDSPSADQLSAMARGVRVQAIYEGYSLRSPGSRLDLARCLEAGEDARILPKLPMKLIIADEFRAIVAMARHDGVPEALVIGPSLLFDSFVALFDLLWEMAIPASMAEPALSTELAVGPTVQTQTLLRLLSAGVTDETIARDLSISQRTLQRRIAEPQRSLGAQTRFQLGVQAARRGWL